MKWTSIVTYSHYWILEENVDLLGSPLGCARRIPAAVACFWGAQCLVEDEHLRKRVISGGSATVDTKANNGYVFHHFFQNLKFDQQKFCEKQDAIKLCK